MAAVERAGRGSLTQSCIDDDSIQLQMDEDPPLPFAIFN